MDLVLEIAGDQIDGARDYQEDAFLTTYLDDDAGDSKSSALVVMADGMGGHAAGNIASNMVTSTFNKFFTGNFGKEALPVVLGKSLEKANEALRESIKETPALDGMGCTMVTAAFTKGKVNWVSVGDSHLYLIRDRELAKVNEDHSYGGYLDRMQAEGIDVEPEAGLSRNMLMSAMTGDEIAQVDCPEDGLQLLPGDRLIVASDGMDTLTPGTVMETCSWSKTPKECVAGLLKAVEDAAKPRQDNTTVIVVDITQKEHQPVAQPSAPAAPAPEVVQDEDEDEDKGGSKTGLIVGVVAVLLLAVGGGAFFMMGGSDEARMEEPAVSSDGESLTGDGMPQSAAEPAAAQAENASAPAVVDAQEQVAVAAQPVTVSSLREIFRDKLKDGSDGPAMVKIAAGTFTMGSGGLSVEADERPAHEVKVKAFAMGQYEVTFADYERFAESDGRAVPDNLYMEKETHPVLFVTWDDAYNYAQWLAQQTGEPYRLPSESEWEYAAGAGETTPFWWGFDVGENRAHCFDCRTGLNPRQPTSIGRFAANPLGLYDTAGNVLEWVHDCYHPNYENAPNDGGVWEGGDCAFRVARGGAYSSTSKSLRSAKRSKWRSTSGYDSIGFRVAKDL